MVNSSVQVIVAISRWELLLLSLLVRIKCDDHQLASQAKCRPWPWMLSSQEKNQKRVFSERHFPTSTLIKVHDSHTLPGRSDNSPQVAQGCFLRAHTHEVTPERIKNSRPEAGSSPRGWARCWKVLLSWAERDQSLRKLGLPWWHNG